jgi:hypothetical protein
MQYAPLHKSQNCRETVSQMDEICYYPVFALNEIFLHWGANIYQPTLIFSSERKCLAKNAGTIFVQSYQILC